MFKKSQELLHHKLIFSCDPYFRKKNIPCLSNFHFQWVKVVWLKFSWSYQREFCKFFFTAWRKVSRTLPRSHTVLNLYEYVVPEKIFRDHSRYVGQDNMLTVQCCFGGVESLVCILYTAKSLAKSFVAEQSN